MKADLMRDPFRPSGLVLAAAAGAMAGVDFGREPGYSVDHRGRRLPDPADPAKKAKRKAQRRARRITRRHG